MKINKNKKRVKYHCELDLSNGKKKKQVVLISLPLIH